MSIECVLQRYWPVGLLECYWHSEPEIRMDIMITHRGLSGRVLNSRPRVPASLASLHCVLEQDTFILA